MLALDLDHSQEVHLSLFSDLLFSTHSTIPFISYGTIFSGHFSKNVLLFLSLSVSKALLPSWRSNFQRKCIQIFSGDLDQSCSTLRSLKLAPTFCYSTCSVTLSYSSNSGTHANCTKGCSVQRCHLSVPNL